MLKIIFFYLISFENITAHFMGIWSYLKILAASDLSKPPIKSLFFDTYF